ncbi:MAG: SUMF1/EgtB/PvdO family nonheme iron enzyme [Pirellulales bacterium]|nr:SUMF1/EgtB/PvdO family nonheme iron enzyme [Pirellulales bacterium]
MQSIELELVKIPAGELTMGVPACPLENKLANPWSNGTVVRVASFWIGKYLVTNAEFRAYLVDSGAARPSHIDRADFDADRQPVVGISWEDAVAYCQWLSDRLGRRYRLPRDSEWEYAARGGSQGTCFPWGNDLSLEHAWFNQQAATKPVGSFSPNGYGLYDVIGNAWEWCEERFNDVATLSKAKNVPTGKPPELNRILRGGSFLTSDRLNLYIAYRHDDPPDLRHHCIGFRVAADD